jgi:putative hydrolase of the HAD superfamily
VVNLVLVDFDDTLVDTAPRFQSARRELFRLLSGLGFSEEEAHRVHHHEIDPGMRERFGLGPARLEHAFRATYEALCKATGLTVDEILAEQASAFGRVVAGPPPIFDGALDALGRLASQLPTVVYTQSGDHEYQLGCIRACGVLDIVPPERVTICEQKTTERFRHLIAEYGVDDPGTVWMIGNSMRADINPALEAGANAILIEQAEPWEHDVVDPFADHFHRAPTFSAAVDFLLGSEA